MLVFLGLNGLLLLPVFCQCNPSFPHPRGPVFPGIPWAIIRGIPGNTVLGGGAGQLNLSNYIVAVLLAVRHILPYTLPFKSSFNRFLCSPMLHLLN